MIRGGVWKCLLTKTWLNIWSIIQSMELIAVGDLGSCSTAGFDESLEHGAVWSRTVEGCFCRELLEAGVYES